MTNTSPCYGCTEKICRKGEKCIPNIVHVLTTEILSDKATKATTANRTHRDLLRQYHRARGIKDQK